MTRLFLNLLVISILLLLPFSSTAKERIMLIGDSLSAGYGLKQDQSWVNLLQNKYVEEKKPIEIINTAISGQTTDNALLKIDTWLQVHEPSHVLIELGGNDGIRGFPIKLLKNHLTELVNKSTQAGATVALMEIQIPPNLGPRYTSMFTNSYHTVAKQTGAYFMPYFMTKVAVDKALMQNDNLHPNAKAQPIIRDFMDIEIDKWLKSIK
ncbi:arylesterase [Pseudoalteromonas aurantia]|uniref:Arylesterase n=1 Tax=Pseudoalteromonas aurantia TaxID=43654 RepID=A0A5S3UWZ0_9GAMM|nr:arylesterase [Pseudoalteromonas aurantia]TMO60351.1 arylesterase [Pseudoalteromonas aurantia]TMO62065.1 arylesterase [Pseudoalteromonas aurantia]TMO73682.1 arylesterase [Pseudoalteromonas aurantia]